MDFLEEYNKWLSCDLVDEYCKKELLDIKDNNEEIEDRFHKTLSFGTAGLRGKMGVGTNRINCLVIGKTTQAYANYLKKNVSIDTGIKVVIAYDSRINSEKYATYAARVLSANNIEVYIFDKLRPTPELSFAVRYLNADGGLNITASHNPKEYNGYKVYNSNGGQIIENEASDIMKEIESIDFSDIKLICDDVNLKYESKEDKIGDIHIMSKKSSDVDEEFYKCVKHVLFDKNDENRKSVKIIYNPLFGAGQEVVSDVLKLNGFSNVFLDKYMSEPNGNFPGLELPNPEFLEVYKTSIELAKEKNADIIIATDPDSDRIGVVAYSEKSKEFELLTGNAVGALTLNYILTRRKENDDLPKNGVIVNTIVTNDLGEKIAQKYGVKTAKTLTGFKYIADYIQKHGGEDKSGYVFGYEDTCGYLAYSEVRDKDAVQMALIISEMATYYKREGKTLISQLDELYKEFGFIYDKTISYKFDGIAGANKIIEIMNNFRKEKLLKVANLNVLEISDISTGIKYNVETGEENKIDLPESNVLKYVLSDGSWIAIRPSGTEAKLKLYFSILGDDEMNALEKYKSIYESVSNIIKVGR